MVKFIGICLFLIIFPHIVIMSVMLLHALIRDTINDFKTHA